MSKETREKILNILNDRIASKNGGKLVPEEHYLGLTSDIWVAFYSYFRKIGVIKNKDFIRYDDFLHKGIWSIQFFAEWAIATQLPKRIYRDEQHRLHSTDHSCIEWHNPNHKNYFIHGVPFGEKMWERIVTGTITVNEILRISNMEQKSAILSVIPAMKLIEELDGKLISTHIQTKKGAEYMSPDVYEQINHKEIKLYRIDKTQGILRDGGPLFIVIYADPSTTRDYFSYVRPEDATTALHVMAKKWGVPDEVYANMTCES